MKNVYDIRFENELVYIIPDSTGVPLEKEQISIYNNTAVILYLYYEDTLQVYYDYIFEIQDGIDIYIISSKKEVLERIHMHANSVGKRYITYILKENRGRDISALLIAGSDIIKRYKYICFLHDKKEREKGAKEDTCLWVENLWGNLIGSSYHIDRVLKLFEANKNLGVLAPPDPIGDYICAWYADGWYKSFDITRQLAKDLQLETDIHRDKPPITLGTALWFRSEALKKLFDVEWKYSDFDDSKLKDTNYLSYGVERIFPYVAQDAGYDTGTVMTLSYAEKQTNYLQHATKKIFSEAEFFFPFLTIEAVKSYKRNAERIIAFAENNKNLFIYGAGQFGRFCFFLLRTKNLLPKGYIVSNDSDNLTVQGLPVVCINQLKSLHGMSIIISVFDKNARREIIKGLEERDFYNYIEFWS